MRFNATWATRAISKSSQQLTENGELRQIIDFDGFTLR